ncbi:hypothetical protein AVEN_116301-1 [Araneus ventricosus]|uniref:Uncharacterized protein n=1 Tax=Araneus ventricosus TaxID=182803 RepID=A0A4Y2JJN0_ARAVE|nr:hypothetical protein AVEN_116301-1 [Araneus ventricosus]
MEISEIIPNLKEKGYKIGRSSQMKNCKEKTPFSLYLIDVKQSSASSVTKECSITEKIVDPTCLNCGEKGHLAAWKGCKALPLIQKTLAWQPGKSYAQAAADETRKEEKTEINNAEPATDMFDLKDSLQALKQVILLLQDFPTLKRSFVEKPKQDKKNSHRAQRTGKGLITLTAPTSSTSS